MNAFELAAHIAARLDEDGLPYAIGGAQHPHFFEMGKRRVQIALPSGMALWFVSAEDLCVMKLLYARTKDLADLERLFAAIPTLDVGYIRSWLTQMVPAGDRRLASLDDLVRRFGQPAP